LQTQSSKDVFSVLLKYADIVHTDTHTDTQDMSAFEDAADDEVATSEMSSFFSRAFDPDVAFEFVFSGHLELYILFFGGSSSSMKTKPLGRQNASVSVYRVVNILVKLDSTL